MTIDDLVNIIVVRGRRDKFGYCIGGCDVLGYIVDVGGFVELLREFNMSDTRSVSFLDAYPEPVGVILGGGTMFRVFGGVVNFFIGNKWYIHKGSGDL